MVLLLEKLINQTNPILSHRRVNDYYHYTSHGPFLPSADTADSAFEDTYDDTLITVSSSSGESLSELNSTDSLSENVHVDQAALRLLAQITEACSKSTLTDLGTSESFWSYLLNDLELAGLLARPESSLVDELTEAFMANLSLLLMCVSAVERESTGVLAVEGCCFSVEFLVKLACMVYEESSRMMRRVRKARSREQSDEVMTMFVLDMSGLEGSGGGDVEMVGVFEQMLITCLRRLRHCLMIVISRRDNLEALGRLNDGIMEK